MPKQKEPIDLIIAKNKKHLTKSEIDERKKREINTDDIKELANIKPPKYLNRRQKDEFKKIALNLFKIGIMTELDIDTLARYLIAKTMYLKCSEEINELFENTAQTDLTKLQKWQTLQNTAFKQCSTCANELGLTISSRCKLVMPEIKKEEPINKFQKFEVRQHAVNE